MAAGQPPVKIQLRRTAARTTAHAHLHVFRLSVDVAHACGMPREVFVFRRDAAGTAEFVGVASFPDLGEYPVGAPGPRGPFYRLDRVDLDLRGTDDYDATWALLQREAAALARAIAKAADLTVAETVAIDQGNCEYLSESSMSAPG
jgi:hypothetical protein